MKAKVSVQGGQTLTHRLDQLRQRLARNSNVYVGVPKGAGQYEDGTPLAVIGAVHEFGSADGKIPERSFLRVPLRSHQETFQQAFRELVPQVVQGQLSMFQIMSQVGAKGAGVSQEAIESGIQPPNAPSTVERKGSSQPLIDTGRLRQAVTHIVGEDES